ncbi:unnamed protein product [marine sediment metagenome]|uniref:Uncharacterized protein n=1 Tax=marine sediment metagenome TaxID=412755 RepID=X1E9R7_9ZZZZ
MKDKYKRKCFKCKAILEKVTDKDYPKLDYLYCNNIDCLRVGLFTILFEQNEEDYKKMD